MGLFRVSLKVHSADPILVLKSIVSDQNPSIRRAPLLAVTRPLPPSDAAPILSAGLKDTDCEVRDRAVYGLERGLSATS